MFLPLGDNIDRRELPIVPAALIWANLMVFAYQMRILYTDPGGADAEFEFVKSWALIPSQLADGEIVGLLTHMFFHADIFHFLGNMFMLWAFARSLEEGLGRVTMLGFYLFFGLVAGVSHAASDWNSDVPMIGASGAIAGLLGAYTVLYGAMSEIRTLVFFGFRPFVINVPAIVYGGGWFILQIVPVSDGTASESGIAWWAHIGGFLAGMVVAAICRKDVQRDLYIDRDGELRFADNKVAPEATEEQPTGDIPVPDHCPYCSEAMDETTRWAANLARCPNDNCKRLIMLEADAKQLV